MSPLKPWRNDRTPPERLLHRRVYHTPILTMNTHTVYFTYGFNVVSSPSEAIAKIVSEENQPDHYFHNVAHYRQQPQWRHITRLQFHNLMNLAHAA